jgi:PHD/YefM family antitoxin component YafN of YafNO toxin-antitoxin module
MLIEMRKTVSLDELSKNAEGIADDIRTSGAVYRIERRGKPGMMLMDADHYEGWRAAIELMKLPDWRARWDRAMAERAAERGRALTDVARELGLDRPAKSHRRGTATRPTASRGAKGSRGASRPR